MLKTCPDSIDVTDLQFKLQCRLKVFENDNISAFPNTNSLLTCASRYGLLFVGSNAKNFQVIQTKILHNYTPKDKDVSNFPRRVIELESSPKHLCVNCDGTILAVVIEKDNCPVALFYDVLSFLKLNVTIIRELRLSSTANIYVREINWNPSLPAIFTACKSDGTLGVYEINQDSVNINELPAAAGCTCFCWSPKGKQIAVGSKDGKITQYKPDLKAVKVINEPKLETPHSLISLQWVSNYQFIGVYQSIQAERSSLVMVIDAPKTGDPTYTNYDDICYSGSSRPPQFYLILQQTWNFLMVASVNSTEVGVLGNAGEYWIQWTLADTARAELPLSSDHQETLPVGLTLDISSTTPLPWGESSIPPCPMLFILSHFGVLCCFNVVYLKQGIASVCTPPDPIVDISGLNTFGISSGSIQVPKAEPLANKPLSAPNQPQIGLAAPQMQFNISSNSNVVAPKPAFPIGNPAQSTPLLSNKFPSKLLSEQMTITPIKPVQDKGKTQGTMFGGEISITPINKNLNSNTNVLASSAAPVDINDKYTAIFSSLNPSTKPQQNTTPVKPIVISAQPIQPKQESAQRISSNDGIQEVPKVTLIPPAAKQQELQIVDPKIKAETNAMLSQMILDEWMYLEAEIKILLDQGKSLKINLGTDEEKVSMIQQIESLQDFVKDATDISVGQSSEIHCLKQNLIQSWAWFEEAKSHYNSSKNEAITLLLKMQPLDSVSEKRLRDIEQLVYYVESQLQQASKALDEQWDGFQDYTKKRYRVQMPTMEAIFQTMVRQNAILQKQTYILKDISMRLRKKTPAASSLLLSLNKDKDLADDFKQLHLDSHDILQLQYEKIKSHAKNLSATKANKLKKLLQKREITHVVAVKPQVSSWTLNQSPASKIRQSISMLGAQSSTRSLVAKNVFEQSTPKTEVTRPVQPTKGITFSPKTELTHTSLSLPVSTGFISLAKGGHVISNTQASAFAPTNFGTVSSTSLIKEPPKNLPAVSTFTMSTSTASPPKPTFVSNKEVASSLSPFVFGSAGTAPSFSFPSNTGSLFKSTSDTGSLFKSTSDTLVTRTTIQSTGKTESSSFPVSFAPSISPLRGVPSSFAGEGVPASTSLAGLKTQTFKEPVTVPSKPFQPTNLSTSVNSPQSSFATVSKPTTETVTTNIIPPPSTTVSGIASIFANLQATLDKNASISTVATTETFKPTLTFTTPTSSVTTTAASIFGLPSTSTSTTKVLFDAVPTTNSGNIFATTQTSAVLSKVETTSTAPGSKLETTEKPKESMTFTFGTIKPTNTSTTVSSYFASSTGSSYFASAKSTDAPPLTSLSQGGTLKSAGSIRNLALAAALPSAASEPSTPTPTTQPSTFGIKTSPSAASVSSGNIFANMSVKPSATVTSIPPILSSSTQSDSRSETTTSVSSASNVFGAKPTTTSTSIFGSPPTSITLQSSLFGTTTQPSSTFSSISNVSAPVTSTTSLNLFATNNSGTAATSLFGIPSSTAATSIFGTSTSTTTTGSNIFVSAKTTPSAFGSPSAVTNVFGSPTTPVTTFGTSSSFGSSASTNIFGGSAAATSTGSVFGSPAATKSSIFGGTQTTTAASSLFGTPSTTSSNIFATTTAAAPTNIFGTPTTSTNIFAGATPVSTTQNVFGNTTTVASPFGAQNTSIFGTPNTTASVFGQPSSFGAAPVFGSPQVQPTTASSIFGQPASFGSAAPVFGSTAATTSSGSIFGNSASSSGFGSGFRSTPTTNAFGTPSTQTSATGAFGFGSLNVGGGQSSGSIFGSTSSSAFQQTPAANPFGKVETKSPFASSGSNIFGSPAPNTGATNVFGTPTTTTNPPFGSAGSFGSPSTFGSSTFGQQAFGQPPAFGSPQPGPFSGSGGSSIAQSGFGSPPMSSFQKPSGFGSPPVFGGTPAFGAAPTFGAASSGPTFGSPEKVFGQPTQQTTGVFGSATAQNTGFGNLASQNTIGFGNLAQQANTPSSSSFSGGSSSFSSWR